MVIEGLITMIPSLGNFMLRPLERAGAHGLIAGMDGPLAVGGRALQAHSMAFALEVLSRFSTSASFNPGNGFSCSCKFLLFLH